MTGNNPARILHAEIPLHEGGKKVPHLRGYTAQKAQPYQRQPREAIRQDEISMAASNVSKHKEVRRVLVERQQKLAAEKGYIMDGRDIGTVVLKDAEVKIYLTASSYARALRRLKQNRENNISSGDLETIQKEIEARDYQDMHRENSPLTKAEDAIEVDSSDLTIEETVEKILAIAMPFITAEETI